jgi:O-antigen/teichoic acid export membrane protein
MGVLQKIRKLISFAGPAVIDQALVSGVNFAVAIILARLLGMEAFGQFTLVLVIMFFGLQLQQALVAAPMMTFAPRVDQTRYFSRLAPLQFLLVLLLSIAAWAFVESSAAFFPKWGLGGLGKATGLLLFFRASQEFMRRRAFIQGLPMQVITMNAISCAIIVIGIFWLHGHDKLNVEAAILLQAFACGVGMGIFHLLKRGDSFSTEDLGDIVRDHWTMGRWLLAASITSYAASNLLLMSGSAVIGSEAAGVFKSAQYTMGAMIVLFQAVENFMPHHLAVLAHEKRVEDFRLAVTRATFLMAAVCIANGLALLIFMEPLIAWLAPGREAIFSTVLKVNLTISLLQVFSYNAQYALRARGIARPIFTANLIAAIFSLFAGKPLTVHFGIEGMAAGFLMVYGFIVLYYIFWYVRHDPSRVD